jgi:hypothetical protein
MLVAALSPVHAIELALENVAGEGRRGPFTLSLDVDAVFEYDVETGSLTSAGTWVGQLDVGPYGYYRFAHKFENFGVDADGIISVRSYECVEGTFGGGMLSVNICGNYRYGPNFLDDGGLVDDETVGPPKSIYDYVIDSLDWDGTNLVLVLSKTNPDITEVFPEYGLTLKFAVRVDQ